MNRTHVDILRKLIRDHAPKGKNDPGLRDMVFVAGGMESLRPFLGTAFIGCSASSELSTLYGLTVLLRRLGCPLVMSKSRGLGPKELPGEIWITFLCKGIKAKVLRQVVSRFGNWELYKVSDETYTLAGRHIADVHSLSLELGELADKLHQDR